LLDTEEQAEPAATRGKAGPPSAVERTADTGEQVALPQPAAGIKGEMCPECGHATLVNEEGCKKCYTCSFSEC